VEREDARKGYTDALVWSMGNDQTVGEELATAEFAHDCSGRLDPTGAMGPGGVDLVESFSS